LANGSHASPVTILAETRTAFSGLLGTSGPQDPETSRRRDLKTST
jgi:hypothetical protein